MLSLSILLSTMLGILMGISFNIFCCILVVKYLFGDLLQHRFLRISCILLVIIIKHLCGLKYLIDDFLKDLLNILLGIFLEIFVTILGIFFGYVLKLFWPS